MPESSAQPRFAPQMTMSNVLALHPKARWVLAAYHFGSCASCRISADETLEQAAAAYGIVLERLLADLNSLLDA